jgi:hypothetical protein
MAEAAGEESPLLEILNRLPGREGGRWVVLPFSLEREGLEIRASLRVFLQGEGPPFRAERLALDLLAQKNAGERRRRVFVLDGAGTSAARTELFLDPPPSERRRASLERELAALLGPLAGTVRVHGEAAVFAPDSRENALPSVDQAV